MLNAGGQADRRLHRRQAPARTASSSGARRRRRSTTCAGSRRTCPATARCAVERLGMRLMGLMLAGPRSRDGAGGADRPRRLERRLPLHGPPGDGRRRACPALVNRLSYTGDLGYEIWVEPAICARSTARSRRRARRTASSTSGCGRCCRCGWRRTSRPGSPSSGRSTAPSRAGWSGSCGSTRTSSAATRRRARREAGPRLRRVSLAIEAENADVMGDEPIWARVARDYGRGRRRRTASARRASTPPARAVPAADARRDGDWRVVGWVTSGGYGHFGRAVAGAGLPAGGAGRARRGRGSSRSRSSGCAGRRGSLLEPPFDPDGARMRA